MKNFNFLKLFAFVIVASILFTACGGEKKAPPTEDFQQVLRDGMLNVLNYKSGEYMFSFNGDVSADEVLVDEIGASSLVLSSDFSGAYDFREEQNSLFSLKLDVGVELEGEPEERAGAELRFVDNTLYFVLSELTDLRGEVPAEMVAPFMNQWWNFPMQEEDLGDPDQVFAFSKDLDDMTPEERQLRELFDETEFFADVEYLGTERVSGVNSYKYSLSLDKDAFVDFSVKSAEIQGAPFSASDIEEMKEGLKYVDVEGTVWIGVEDEALRKFDGSVEVTELNGVSATLDIAFELSNLDGNVSVPVPENSMEFDIMMLLGGMM